MFARWSAVALLALSACSAASRDLDAAHEHARHKDFAAAAADYQRVLLDLGRDESASACELRAATLLAIGLTQELNLDLPAEAARSYRELSERYPERPETFEARAHLADLLRDRFHDTRAALAQLAALVQSFPNHLDTDRYQYRAAQDYFTLHDYAQTETEAKLLLARYPGSSVRTDAQMLLAACAAMQGRKKEALAAYAEIAKQHPGADAGRANFEIARIQEESGDYEAAESTLARAIVDHPEPAVVSMALERVRKRVALRRPVDVHDHAAIFDHKNGEREPGGE